MFQDNNLIREVLYRNSEIKPCGCWELTRSDQNHTGHRRITINGKRDYGHRWAMVEQLGEPVPFFRVVCHICDNPTCCNPDHVYLGDYLSNRLDQL